MVTKPMGQVAADIGGESEARMSRALDTSAPREPSPTGLLSRTIATEVVPRLLMIHRAAPTQEEAHRPLARDEDVAALAAAVLADDMPAAEAVIESVRTRGATLEEASLDLLAPAARHLGAMWVEDDCTYTDVTLGTWRLQRILRNLSPLFEPRTDHVRGGARRALISVLPGEDHSFGTDVVAGFLRLAGWEVANETTVTLADLAERVRRDPASVVGLSCGCGEDLSEVAGIVTTLRNAAARPLGVMLGGYAFSQDPSRALRLGADAVAHDARHAVRQAESLLQFVSLSH